MARAITALDIDGKPDVVRLVDEIGTTGNPVVLRLKGKDIAVLTPLDPARDYPWREPTAEDREAFRSAAGSWKGNVDVDRFVRANYESRRRSSRRPVNL